MVANSRKTGVSLANGILGSVPGGFAQMILMAEEIEGADVTVITLMQMARVLAVLFIVPFVAACGIVHLTRPADRSSGRGTAGNRLQTWGQQLFLDSVTDNLICSRAKSGVVVRHTALKNRMGM